VVTLTVTVSVDCAIALGRPSFAVTSGYNSLEETPEVIFTTKCGYSSGLEQHITVLPLKELWDVAVAFAEASSHAGEDPQL